MAAREREEEEEEEEDKRERESKFHKSSSQVHKLAHFFFFTPESTNFIHNFFPPYLYSNQLPFCYDSAQWWLV